MNKTGLPAWVRVLAGTAFVLMALIAGSLSAAINIRYGLKTDLFEGLFYGLTDGAKIAIPIIAAALAVRSFKLIAAQALFIAISVWTAYSYFTETGGQKMLDIKTQQEARGTAGETIARARAELAAITEKASADALRIMEEAARTRAEAEANNGGCLKKCMERNDELAAIAERRGMAERRDKLEAAVRSATVRKEAAQPKTFGATDHLAALFNVPQDVVARLRIAGETIAKIIGLELLASFSGYGVLTLMSGLRGDGRRLRTTSLERIGPEESRETSALLRLRMLAMNSPGQAVDIPRRDLAERLDLPLSTLQDWLKKWAAAELIHVEKSRITFKVAA